MDFFSRNRMSAYNVNVTHWVVNPANFVLKKYNISKYKEHFSRKYNKSDNYFVICI